MRIQAPLLAAALAGVCLVVPAAAVAGQPAQLRLTLPEPDPRLSELRLTASCPGGCTVALTQVSVLRMAREGGTPVQLAGASTAPLRGSRRVPAGKRVAIAVPLPDAVQGTANDTLARGAAIFGTLTVEVRAKGGPAQQAVRQFAVHTAGTRPPFPPSAGQDIIAVPRAPKRGPGKPLRYAVSVEGTQTARWAYHHETQEGTCHAYATGSGRQTLTFRSTKAVVGTQTRDRRGEPIITAKGQLGLVALPIALDATRSGTEGRATNGGCPPQGGEPGTDGLCDSRDSAKATFTVFYGRRSRLFAGVSMFSWDRERPVPQPDCPLEQWADQWDPLDVARAAPHRDADLTRGGTPGKVVEVYRVDRTDPLLGGGQVTLHTRYTVTFRRVN